MRTRQIRVRGRVQGVGFRYALRDEAERLGVRGWVRNRADGSVEALLHGEPHAVDELIAWTRRGPPGARVEQLIDEAPQPDLEASYDRFEIRPTA
jgi:acylphosphatase